MMRASAAVRLLAICIVAAWPLASRSARAGEPRLERVPPREPAEAERTFETLDGFQMQLVAAEPDVTDPVAAAFDENGLLYVTEMIDYPIPPAPGRTPLGRVRLLNDADGDGRYEQSWIFAEGIAWPTGVAPWKQGVFVAAAPDIWYLKDTDGDHRADTREKVFTGFGDKNQQGTVNNLAWSIENRIYGSASTNGGNVRPGDGSSGPIALGGRDFRFEPESRQFETVSGHEQFGNAFDDWGSRFLCSESKPAYHVVLPEEYVKRNPYLAAPTALEDLAPGVTPIHRISPVEAWRAIRSSRRLQAGERKETSAGLSHEVIDAAAGLTIYRGDAYPEQYRGNLFVGCSQNNLIHRRLVVPAGPTFASKRADEGAEFVRTSDIWFRPVNCVNAPDGTLFVLDMSREVIEAIHIPLDVVAQLDLTSGRDRGRIYRLAPPGFRPKAPPQLGELTAAELVARLESKNGWTRDTAQRLLYQRQDKTAIEPSRRLLRKASLPQARLHALWTLAGLGALANEDCLAGLNDESPRVREHALRLAERRLDDCPQLLAAATALADDDDARVRFQAAFSLGYSRDPSVRRGLAAIARRDVGNHWTATAILSSANELAAPLFVELTQNAAFAATADGAALVDELARVVGARKQAAEIEAVATAIAGIDSKNQPRAIYSLAIGARQSGARLQDLLQSESTAVALFGKAIKRAQAIAADPAAAADERELAIRMLAFAPFADAFGPLRTALVERENEALQLAAVQTLSSFGETEAAGALIEAWPAAGPRLRDAIYRPLAARPDWAEQLLVAIEEGTLPASDLAPSQRNELTGNQDDQVRRRALRVLGSVESQRSSVIDGYRPTLELTGDAARGDKIYDRECSACHQLGERGFAVGPNLALTRNRSPEQLLSSVLDPNRDVQPNYLQYVVVDSDGRTTTGIVVAETGSSVTLGREKGARETILKSNIAELSSTGRSLMPEGFEKTIDRQAMADLLAFLATVQYDIGTIPGEAIPGQADQ